MRASALRKEPLLCASRRRERRSNGGARGRRGCAFLRVRGERSSARRGAVPPECAVPSVLRYGGDAGAERISFPGAPRLFQCQKFVFDIKRRERGLRVCASSLSASRSVRPRPSPVRLQSGRRRSSGARAGRPLPSPRTPLPRAFLCLGRIKRHFKRENSRGTNNALSGAAGPWSSPSVLAKGSGCEKSATPHSATAAGSSFCCGNSVGKGKGKISSLALTPQPLTGRSQLSSSSSFRFAPRGGAEGRGAGGPGGGR